MRDQIQIIRDFFKPPVPHSPLDLGEYIIEHIIEQRKALTALAQLEVMAEQEPVAWFDEQENMLHWSNAFKPELPKWPHAQFYSKAKAPEVWMPLYAAPVAQPQAVHNVYASFIAESAYVISTTKAPIKRVQWEDDGTLHVYIDHWPQQAGQVSHQKTKKKSNHE